MYILILLTHSYNRFSIFLFFIYRMLLKYYYNIEAWVIYRVIKIICLFFFSSILEKLRIGLKHNHHSCDKYNKTALAQHAIKNNHGIKFEETKIIIWEKHIYREKKTFNYVTMYYVKTTCITQFQIWNVGTW